MRKTELYESCKILSIEEGNILLCKLVFILITSFVECSIIALINFRNTLLPDDPRVNWDITLLSDKITEHVEQLEIDTILTFDSYGVSGHRNHISIYLALFHLIYNKLLPDCKYLMDIKNL